jgi:hypothetical protein
MARHNGGHDDDEYTSAGTTIASTTAGTTMAATATAGHIKHGHDKAVRGTPKAGLYLYFACLYDHYYYCATRATKTNSTVQQQVAKPARACLNRSKLRISPLILYPSYDILVLR